MRPLVAAGCTADALSAYEQTRTRLLEERGGDPGAALGAAQAAVFTLDYPEPPPAAAAHFDEMESILRDVLTRAESRL